MTQSVLKVILHIFQCLIHKHLLHTLLHTPHLCISATNTCDTEFGMCGFFPQETNYQEGAAQRGRTPTQTQWKAGTAYQSGWVVTFT